MNAREQAIEAGKTSLLNHGLHSANVAGQLLNDAEYATAISQVVLDALLAVTQDEPCETCGGDPEFDPLTEAGNRSDLHCPDCTNGRRAGTVPLVLLGPEQVTPELRTMTHRYESLYRARLLPEPEERP